mmetsp:Transcript_33902/g.49752  ORF Transcript_33902/g.49752 Transcript_33902/m.49752 type:complete len:217 (-) Transcript_33902:3057-3707(-)
MLSIIAGKKRIMWKGPKKQRTNLRFRNMHSTLKRNDFFLGHLSFPEVYEYYLERSTKRLMSMMGFPMWSLQHSCNSLVPFASHTRDRIFDNPNTCETRVAPTAALKECAHQSMASCFPNEHKTSKVLLSDACAFRGIESCAILSSSCNNVLTGGSTKSNEKYDVKYPISVFNGMRIQDDATEISRNNCPYKEELPEKPFARKHLEGHLIMGIALLK